MGGLWESSGEVFVLFKKNSDELIFDLCFSLA